MNIRPLTEAERLHLQWAERERLAKALKAHAVLTSREYGFCLYPQRTLRDFLLAFLSGRP